MNGGFLYLITNEVNNVKYLVIPENHLGIVAADYSNDDLAELLRNSKNNPEQIHFIADMIEDGEGSLFEDED